MVRKPRIEYPGAVYHLIGRGNYRKALFEPDGAGEALERAIGETSVRCGSLWLAGARLCSDEQSLRDGSLPQSSHFL